MRGLIPDRVGIGWRPELAAGILMNLDRIDVVEVIADDYFGARRSKVRAIASLARQVPVTLHAVGLGLASTSVVERWRLDQMARLMDVVRPESWSEHLAFVRAGGIEIGHLAAPPRNGSTVEGTAENIYRATRLTGSKPGMENIATLIDPPGSVMAEACWIKEILIATGSKAVLDLHNLYANAMNFRFDAAEFLDGLDGVEIQAIHIAGGKQLHDSDRILDDHLHDVPDPVFDLLTEVARRVSEPLTVILERDGEYPSMQSLLRQLDRARTAIAIGRSLRPVRKEHDHSCV